MRKIIIFFIILTIIGTVSLVAINLRKDSSHTDDTSEAEISQPIDLSGLDSYQPVSGSVATITNAGADEESASQSFTIRKAQAAKRGKTVRKKRKKYRRKKRDA